jgi:hypothetical protein
MAYFRLYNADGSLQVDLSNRLTRFIGAVSVSGTGSIAVPVLDGGTPWASLHADSSVVVSAQASVSGNTISWNIYEGSAILVYGEY